MTTQVVTLEQVSRLIRQTHRPLLICHVEPDEDAIGSMTALGLALRHEGKMPIMACSDPIPARFRYIPAVETIVQEVNAPFDLVVSLDCSDTARMGRFPQMPAFGSVPLVNLDHHVTNLNFGMVNLVDPTAASTAEIVLRLLEHLDISLDIGIATALLAGIVTDTRGFRTDNTTVATMEAALKLMKTGATLAQIAYLGLDRRSIAAVRLWGAALARLRIEGRVLWASIPLATRRAAGYAGNGDAGLANFLIGAEEAEVAAVFTEREDSRIEVGLRAASGFDVAQVALQFGGGGHPRAAGCNIPGPLEEAQARVLAALQAALKREK